MVLLAVGFGCRFVACTNAPRFVYPLLGCIYAIIVESCTQAKLRLCLAWLVFCCGLRVRTVINSASAVADAGAMVEFLQEIK